MIFELLFSFMVIGVSAFGGGNVTIPLISHEIVTKHQWLTGLEMSEVVALAQMTPGPLAINAATFTGYRIYGFIGAIVATVGVILPSLVIMSIIVFILLRFGKYKYIGVLKQSVKPGVIVMFILAVWSIGKTSVSEVFTLMLAIQAFILMCLFGKRLHPVVLILAYGIIGVVLL